MLAAGLAGCAPARPAPTIASAPGPEPITVIAAGWHTELALPLGEITGPLAALKPAFPAAHALVFGWGARDYYMAANPGIGDLLRAAFSGPAVVLVIPLRMPPASFAGASTILTLGASHAGIARLSQFLWDDIDKDGRGIPRRVGTGPYPGSVFYASTAHYDLAHTCNTWTAEALGAAGLAVNPADVVFADQLLDQLPPSAGGVERGLR